MPPVANSPAAIAKDPRYVVTYLGVACFVWSKGAFVLAADVQAPGYVLPSASTLEPCNPTGTLYSVHSVNAG